MNTLILAFALLLSPIQSSPQPQSQTIQHLDFQLTDLNKVSVSPITSISEDGGLELKDLFITLNGYTRNLELDYSHFDHLVNEFTPGELTWEKSIMLETSFILPLTAHRQHITMKGVTRITNFVDRNNFQVESELIEVKGVNKSVLWIHLLLELHLVLLIVAIITILNLKAKPTKLSTRMMIIIPAIGPLAFSIYWILSVKRMKLAKS